MQISLSERSCSGASGFSCVVVTRCTRKKRGNCPSQSFRCHLIHFNKCEWNGRYSQVMEKPTAGVSHCASFPLKQFLSSFSTRRAFVLCGSFSQCCCNFPLFHCLREELHGLTFQQRIITNSIFSSVILGFRDILHWKLVNFWNFKTFLLEKELRLTEISLNFKWFSRYCISLMFPGKCQTRGKSINVQLKRFLKSLCAAEVHLIECEWRRKCEKDPFPLVQKKKKHKLSSWKNPRDHKCGWINEWLYRFYAYLYASRGRLKCVEKKKRYLNFCVGFVKFCECTFFLSVVLPTIHTQVHHPSLFSLSRSLRISPTHLELRIKSREIWE